MALKLDPVRVQGERRLAVICEVTSRVNADRDGVYASGGKRPVAVVFHDGAALEAMDMRGRPLDVETLARDCPGLLDAFGDDQASGDQSISGPAGTMPSGLRSSEGEK